MPKKNIKQNKNNKTQNQNDLELKIKRLNKNLNKAYKKNILKDETIIQKQ